MAKAKAKQKETKKSPKVPENTKWYKKGEAGLQEKKQSDAIAKMKKEKAVTRFRLQKDSGAKIVFVDSEGFYIWEHNLNVGGKWGNFITCVKDFDSPCDVCLTGKRSTHTAYYTVIDTREFIRQDGTKVKNRKILFPAKGTMIYQLEDMKKRHGSLAGMVFEVKRFSADGEPNCGSVLTKLGKINIKKKFGDGSDVPVDYVKVLAPASKEEIRALGVGGAPLVGSSEDLGETDTELEDLFD